ncbi:hypothetical protein Btru_006219 [Bulinus truncatus]|nr:hypothetical protein Btru_006219 [Bulinus truncatus]
MKFTSLCLVIFLLAGVSHVSQGAAICSNIVNCFVAPCRFAVQCSVPGSVCQDDYCGGCNARWYVGSTEVTSQCSAA